MARGKKKELKPEKAATVIGDMIDDGTASSPEDAVKQRPELKRGLEILKPDTPAPVASSRGSGPMVLDVKW